jgi:hypothetical protein
MRPRLWDKNSMGKIYFLPVHFSNQIFIIIGNLFFKLKGDGKRLKMNERILTAD